MYFATNTCIFEQKNLWIVYAFSAMSLYTEEVINAFAAPLAEATITTKSERPKTKRSTLITKSL
jgi:hypothetical protein